MLPNHLQCSACYFFRRTFNIYKKTNIPNPILFKPRITYLHRLKSCSPNLFPKIVNYDSFKYYSQISSVKPVESNVDVRTEKGKVFRESENGFFHSILKNKVQYKTFDDKNEQFFQQFVIDEKEFNDIVNHLNWSCVSVEDTVNSFFKASVYCAKHIKLPISDELFTNLCIGLVQVSNKLNDEQLLNCIKALGLWTPCDSVKANNFLDVWKALDKECYLRFRQKTWDLDTSLYVMDLWYALKLTRLSEFVYKTQIYISRKVRSFQPNHLIHMLFFMNICRKVHPEISMYEYEYMLEKYALTHLTIDELAIAASGFFKTQKRISSAKLLSTMTKRLTEEVDTVHDITIASILKVIRFSFKAEIINDVIFLFTKLLPRMDSLSLTGCVHMILALTPMIIFNEKAINKIVDRFLENPAAARLKDLEKIAFILSLYDYIPESAPHILNTIMNELNEPRRKEELCLYRRSLANLLFYLSLLKIFPQNLIATVLDMAWIEETYGGKHPYRISNVLLSLDYNVEVECPEAKVPRLQVSKREYISKKNADYIPDPNEKRQSAFNQQFLHVLNATEDIFGGKEFYLIHYTLPHYCKPDIVYCLNDDNKPVPIPEEMRNIPHFSGILKPTQPGNWRCVVIASRLMFSFNSQIPVGALSSKIRQLKIIGYTPVVIPWYRWNGCKDEEFNNYVKEQLFSKHGN